MKFGPILRRLWGPEVPAVHRDWWDDQIVPTDFRAHAADVQHPVPVDEYRPTPAGLLLRPPLAQLLLCGEALLLACYDPALHYSLVSGRLTYAAGVTILLVETRHDGEIITAPWSMGESRGIALRHLIEARRRGPVRLSFAEAYVVKRLLPRCAAAISVVGHLGIDRPGTNIMASGGEAPISVTVGRESIHFVLDHRVYDPADAALLYHRFFTFLSGGAA